MDIKFFQSNDGGEIEYVNGLATTEDGLVGAALISLFGGNDDDDGTDSTAAIQWWGNFLEEEGEPRQIRSRFQALTLTTPLNSATLQLFQEAAEADLAWMVDAEVVDSFTIETSIAGPKRLQVDGQLNVRTDVYPFSFEIQTDDTKQ